MTDSAELYLPKRKDLQELVDLGLVSVNEIPKEFGRYRPRESITEMSHAQVIDKMKGRIPKTDWDERFGFRKYGINFPFLRAKWDAELGSGLSDVTAMQILPYSLMNTVNFRCNFPQSFDSRRTVGVLNGGWYNTHILFKDVFALYFKGYATIRGETGISPEDQIKLFKQYVKEKNGIDLDKFSFVWVDAKDNIQNLWLMQKPSLSESDILFHCSCPFYRFYASHSNVVYNKTDSTGKYRKYDRKPRSSVPERDHLGIGGECKHIYYLIYYLSTYHYVVDSYGGVSLSGKEISKLYKEFTQWASEPIKKVGVEKTTDDIQDKTSVVGLSHSDGVGDNVSVVDDSDGVDEEETTVVGDKVKDLGKVIVSQTKKQRREKTTVVRQAVKKDPVEVVDDEVVPPDELDLDSAEKKPKKIKKIKKKGKDVEAPEIPKEESPADKVTVTEIPTLPQKDNAVRKASNKSVVADEPSNKVNVGRQYVDYEEKPEVLSRPITLPSSIVKTDTIGGEPIAYIDKLALSPKPAQTVTVGSVEDTTQDEQSIKIVPPQDLAAYNDFKDRISRALSDKYNRNYPYYITDSLNDFRVAIRNKPEIKTWGNPSNIELIMIVAMNLNDRALDAMETNLYDDIRTVAGDVSDLLKLLPPPKLPDTP